MYPLQGPETVSGGVFQLHFNGLQVSSPGPRHTQCEQFLHNILPSPGYGHSKCDLHHCCVIRYKARGKLNVRVYSKEKTSEDIQASGLLANY